MSRPILTKDSSRRASVDGGSHPPSSGTACILILTVDGVAGRTRARAEDLKPEPYLLRRALDDRGAKPADAVLIGDSITDIQAARAAGTAVIAFANRPGKDRALCSFEPEVLIRSMDEIAASPGLQEHDQGVHT